MKAAKLEHAKTYWIGRFQAMASPCELLMEVDNAREARMLLDLAQQEAKRIEEKFSRYRDDNITHKINHARGEPVSVDEETAGLLDYAAQCYELSDGMFDVTSGVLRQAWHFDGSDNIPQQETITALLSSIGWSKLNWQRPVLTLPQGMEIDLGGIGKEYAVDRTALLIKQKSSASALINYGGDLYVTHPRKNGGGWFVGMEDPNHPEMTDKNSSVKQFELSRGGIATSGDSRRYLLKDGIRYSHILNPKTGWPVNDAPHSITVIAATCTDAGILATLAMLHGAAAEEFLQEQEVQFDCIRGD
jgi:thiamine biosynthesis lipoprotein